MTPRFSYTTSAPNPYDAMDGLESYLEKCAIEQPLVHLAKLRASQINGCAYCIDMHWKDLRALGESELRLYLLDAWRESPQFTPRERAALAWTEAVTLVADSHVPDDVFGEVRQQFNERELADLTLVIATINAWNRLSISARALPGAYVSRLAPAPA
jgi:AhpD family alkylhydroperoxidase